MKRKEVHFGITDSVLFVVITMTSYRAVTSLQGGTLISIQSHQFVEVFRAALYSTVQSI
jgi:hypothetical protein